MKMPMGSGVPTRPRGGTHRAHGSNIPTHRYRVTHAGSYSHIQHVFSEPTLLWAAKGVLYPHVGGTVIQRAQRIRSVLSAEVSTGNN